MSHFVSLHFESPFEDGSLESKLEAVDGFPVKAGDHIEIVGIWKNEDGSIGVHVEIVEMPSQTETVKSPNNENRQPPENKNEAPAKEEDVVEKAPHDDLTKADTRYEADDEALKLTPDMQEAEEELEENFDLAAEGQTREEDMKQKLKKEIEESYDRQKKIQEPSPDMTGTDN